MKPEMIFKKILRERDFSSQRSEEALNNFIRKVTESVQLVVFVENKSKKNIVKLNGRKNYVINLVTAAEIYFRDLIKMLPDARLVRKNSSGLSKLLDDQITIWDAYQLLRTRRSKSSIKVGEILAIMHLFESLAIIDSTFSTLLGCSFLREVENHRRKLNKTDAAYFEVNVLHLAENLPEWRSQVGKLFDKRHEFVHQVNFNDQLSYDDIRKFWWHLVCFIYAVDCFVEDKYLKPSARPSKGIKRGK